MAVYDFELAARALRLFPFSPYLRAEWMRAVGVVRGTSQGWILERASQRITD